MTLEASLLASIVLLLVHVGRRWPSPLRYGLLLVALLKFAIPPTVAFPTGLYSGLFNGLAEAPQQAQPSAPIDLALSDGALPVAPVSLPTETAANESPASTTPTDPVAAATSPTPARDAEAATLPSASTLALLALLAYLAGLAVFLTLLARELLWNRRILRSSRTDIPDRLREVWQEVGAALGARGLPQLRLGPMDVPPMALGVVRRHVVVPPSVLDVSRSQQRAVLAHELAHHRRADLWVNFLQVLLSIAWWFNPLIWRLNREIRRVREDCCDDFLLERRLSGAADYCRGLLDLAKLQGSASALRCSAGLNDSGHPLVGRVHRILDRTLSHTAELGGRSRLALAGVALLVLPGISGVAQPDPTLAPEKSLVYEGEVRDPDGAPLEGAKLHLGLGARPGYYWSKHYPAFPLLAETDVEGRFRFELKGSIAKERWWSLAQLAVQHDDFALTWQPISEKPQGVMQLQLVEDDTPIRGRILSLEGIPLQGVTVLVRAVWHAKQPSLAPFAADLKAAQMTRGEIERNHFDRHLLLDPPEYPYDVTTDEDGAFEIHGVGANRAVSLELRGDSVQLVRFGAVTSDAIDRILVDGYTYHGASFDYYAAPTRIVHGTVTDRDTGAPLTGMTVQSETIAGDQVYGRRDVFTKTDAEGRYRLVGLPKGRGNSITVVPPLGTPYLAAFHRLPDPPSAGPMAFDVSLKEVPMLEGQIVDRETGMGLAHAALKHDSESGSPILDDYRYEASVQPWVETDDEGRFRIPVMPGKGWLGVTVTGKDSAEYVEVPPDWPEDDIHPLEYHGEFNVILPLVVKQNNPPHRRIELTKGLRVSGQVVDSEGTPVATGLRVFGETPDAGFEDHSGSTFTLRGIHPEHPRTVLFHHPQRRLAAVLQFESGKIPSQSIQVELQPTATLSGRMLTNDGKPRGRAVIQVWYVVDGISFRLPPVPPITTNDEGRFEVGELIPGMPYSVMEGKGASISNVVCQGVELKPGEKKDIGDAVAPPPVVDQ